MKDHDEPPDTNLQLEEARELMDQGQPREALIMALNTLMYTLNTLRTSLLSLQKNLVQVQTRLPQGTGPDLKETAILQPAVAGKKRLH